MVARLIRLAAVSLLAASMALAGCSGPEPTFVDDDGVYDSDSAVELLEQADSGTLAEEPAEKASELRHRYLTALRRQGGGAATAAELITRTFPAETDAVPFYVEWAQFGEQPAYIIVEALGRPGGALLDKRLWVIDEQGTVLLSGTR
jgi:glutathione S-transferase